MKLEDNGSAFTIWLSAKDTQDWSQGLAPRGKISRWPVAQLAGRRVKATFDESGLIEFTVDGRDISGARLWVPVDEFNALVADFAETKLSKDHPCYYVAVGQFARG